MNIVLPENVNRIIQKLNRYGYEAYAVGGCVRDSLLGRTPQDWDITTSALPSQVKELFHHTIDTGIQHGTVTVMLDHVGYEVTTYRIDGTYEDARHPKEVTFTSLLTEDLKRRDFTINAMAYNEERGLVDEFDGIRDLNEGIVRCVGEPRERFSEDALRMLRAVRFAAQLGFSIDTDTKAAVRELSGTIAKVSAERIQAELVKLLVSDHPQEIRTAYELGLTRVFLPEFDRMMETEQVNKHHIYTVGEHTICAMGNVRPDKILRLTMLLHDVAKPPCRTTDEKGQNHFKGHPQMGEQMTKEILRRLKFDNDTIRMVSRLVLYHDERPPITDRNVRRIMSRMGEECFPQIFEVQRADVLAQSMYHRQEKLAYILAFEEQYRQILKAGQCVKKSDLSINGRDLIEMGIPQGKQIGEVLDRLFEQVLETPELNTREKLLELAHKMIPPFI
jgi:tRNA nucleotidyltransferase (CCA-adding enzyme)